MTNVIHSSPVIAAAVEGELRGGLGLLLQLLLEREVTAYLERHRGARDAAGRCVVTRNGFARLRAVRCGPVTLAVAPPRVNDRRVVDGVRQRFASRLLPAGRALRAGNTHLLAAHYLAACAEGHFAPVVAVLPAELDTTGIGEHLAARRVAVLGRTAELRFDSFEAAVLRLDALSPATTSLPMLLVLVGVQPSGDARLVRVRAGEPTQWSDWTDLVGGAVASQQVSPHLRHAVESASETCHARAVAQYGTASSSLRTANGMVPA